MTTKMTLKQFIQERRQEYIEILKDLVRQDTTNPPGNEFKAAKVIHKRLEQLGIPFTTHEKEEGRTNTIARIGSKDEKNKSILFSAHLDVVPAGDGWATPPFEPTIHPDQPNMMYGRGTADDKGQATAILLIAEYLKSIESRLKNEFIFVWAADEETGSSLGIEFLLENDLIKPDYVIIPDVSGAMKKIDIAEKGILNLKVTSFGKQAHGANPDKGLNAILLMNSFLEKLSRLTLKHEPHPILSPPTINIGTIHGGSAPNIVPAQCECILNIRYLPSQKSDSIIEELKTLTDDRLKFEILVDIPPTEVAPDNLLVKTIQEVAKKRGIDAKLHGLSGGTDTKKFVLRDIPAVGYDFGDDYIAHNADEYCNLDNLFLFSDIMVDVCLALDSRVE